MRRINYLLGLALCLLVTVGCNCPKAQISDKGTKWAWQEGTIVTEEPQRPAGQESVIGLTAPKMDGVRVAFVGLGMRGPGAVQRFTHIPGVEVVALCDYNEEAAHRCQRFLKQASMPKAAVYSGAAGSQ